MEEDRILVEKILENDEQAFASLVSKYQRMVYATCFRLVRSRSDAEDLSQDVFMEVFRSLLLVRKENDLSGWLYRIALNKSLSFLRKRNPVKPGNGAGMETTISALQQSHAQSGSTGAQLEMEQEETRKLLFQAIDRLPENQKRAILLHKFEDFSQKEICEQMGLSRVSVESLIYRAKTNLRKSLFNHFKHLTK